MGRVQKLLSGFFPLREGGYPPIPLSFFGHNDFPLRGGGRTPQSVEEKFRYKTAAFGQKRISLTF